jgi:23S rRNA pseudouridine1911/1915/1917 synthase
VHRLDRGTSGLLVVAKNDHAHRGLAEQFAAHTAGRRYLALVYGAVRATAGTARSHLARHPKDRLRWTSTSEPGVGRRAVTHWERLGVAGTVSLVGCRLETGRTHQVRVHLEELGHPILGDPLYRRRGLRSPASVRDAVMALDGRPLLHAWHLQLEHPRSGEALSWIAPPPPDMLAIIERLGLSQALPAAPTSRCDT